MPERNGRLPDSGEPDYSRFADANHPELNHPFPAQPREQAQEVFLTGCSLPDAWNGYAQWRILETSFELGLNFLFTWQSWKNDLQRPKLLHFVSINSFSINAEEVFQKACTYPDLRLLASQLRAQIWGLLPGFHRLVFENGQVLLTLCIGDLKTVLDQQKFEADLVYLNGFDSPINPDTWNVHTVKALARCCRRGTRIASSTPTNSLGLTLRQCGFIVKNLHDTSSKNDKFQAEYNPPWGIKKISRQTARVPMQPTTCVVVGSGLAGAAVAASLARRGWQVLVLDAASAPASGASSLPAGLLVPHISPDDSTLSRLSRCGVRLTLQQAGALLNKGSDWDPTGVLEHAVNGLTRKQPQAWAEPSWAGAAADWSKTPTPDQLMNAGLPLTTAALWHVQAGWIKPACLVNAWLATPGIKWLGNMQAAQLRSTPQGWQVLDAQDVVLAQADLVVLAAACGSRALAATINDAPLALQPVRGQVSWSRHKPQHHDLTSLPAFPVNGSGALIPAVPGPNGLTWILGSSYERDCETTQIKPNDHIENLARLQKLLPKIATPLAQQFNVDNDDHLQGWTGVRCTTPRRLPVLGCVAVANSGAEVWVCSGMGSRGLSFAALCGELLAARLHHEPLPLDQRLAQALSPSLNPVMA